MRSVRGNRYGVASNVRPNPRLGVGLALTFAVINACGGRTLELEGGQTEGEGAEGGVGGVGARTGVGGSNGGVGGGSTGVGGGSVGGTGVGGSVSSGGGPSPGARGGGTSTGGTAGVAGTTTGGTGMVGGRGGGSSVGGTSPGKGGGGGRPGMPPGRGAGGGAGAPGSGGAAGTAGAAGAGGSPAVYEACRKACANIPSVCPVSSGAGECESSCDDLSFAYAGCRLELTDYIDCIAERLRPDAMCAVSSSGECTGEGCTTDAVDACAPLLQLADDCMAGCGTSFGVTPDGCEFQRVCSTHWVESWCKTDVSGRWLCTCAVDGAIGASVVLYGDAGAVCTSAASYCDFAR